MRSFQSKLKIDMTRTSFHCQCKLERHLIPNCNRCLNRVFQQISVARSTYSSEHIPNLITKPAQDHFTIFTNLIHLVTNYSVLCLYIWVSSFNRKDKTSASFHQNKELPLINMSVPCHRQLNNPNVYVSQPLFFILFFANLSVQSFLST